MKLWMKVNKREAAAAASQGKKSVCHNLKAWGLSCQQQNELPRLLLGVGYCIASAASTSAAGRQAASLLALKLCACRLPGFTAAPATVAAAGAAMLGAGGGAAAAGPAAAGTSAAAAAAQPHAAALGIRACVVFLA